MYKNIVRSLNVLFIATLMWSNVFSPVNTALSAMEMDNTIESLETITSASSLSEQVECSTTQVNVNFTIASEEKANIKINISDDFDYLVENIEINYVANDGITSALIPAIDQNNDIIVYDALEGTYSLSFSIVGSNPELTSLVTSIEFGNLSIEVNPITIEGCVQEQEVVEDTPVVNTKSVETKASNKSIILDPGYTSTFDDTGMFLWDVNEEEGPLMLIDSSSTANDGFFEVRELFDFSFQVKNNSGKDLTNVKISLEKMSSNFGYLKAESLIINGVDFGENPDLTKEFNIGTLNDGDTIKFEGSAYLYNPIANKTGTYVPLAPEVTFSADQLSSDPFVVFVFQFFFTKSIMNAPTGDYLTENQGEVDLVAEPGETVEFSKIYKPHMDVRPFEVGWYFNIPTGSEGEALLSASEFTDVRIDEIAYDVHTSQSVETYVTTVPVDEPYMFTPKERTNDHMYWYRATYSITFPDSFDAYSTSTVDVWDEVITTNNREATGSNVGYSNDAVNEQQMLYVESAELDIEKSVAHSNGAINAKTCQNAIDRDTYKVINSGDSVCYQLKVSNNADRMYSDNTIIRDELTDVDQWMQNPGSAVGFEYIIYDDRGVKVKSGSGADIKVGTTEADNVDIPAGGYVQVDFLVDYGTNLPNVTEIPNVATVNASNDNYGYQSLESNEAIVIAEDSKFTIEKNGTDASEDGILSPEENVNYEITAKNISTSDTKNIRIYDEFKDDILQYGLIETGSVVVESDQRGPLVGGVDYIDNSIYNQSPPLLDIELKEFFADESITIKFNFSISDDIVWNENVSVITNTVCLDSPLVGTKCDAEDDHEFTPPTTKIELTKEVLDLGNSTCDVATLSSDLVASPGECLKYSISVSNVSDISAYNVFVKDDLADLIASGVDVSLASNALVTMPDGSTLTGDLISGITIPEIKKGESVLIEFNVIVGNKIIDTELTNIAKATAENCVIEGSEDCIEEDDAVIPTGDSELTLDKETTFDINNEVISQGSIITYTFDVTNTSDVDAIDVILEDKFDVDAGFAGATILDVRNTDPNFVYTDNSVLTGDIDLNVMFDLAANSTTKFEVDVKLADDVAGSEITSLSNEADLIDDEEIVSEDTVVLPGDFPLLTMSKDVTDADLDGYAEENEALTYSIKVANNSQFAALNTHVFDQVEELQSLNTIPDLSGNNTLIVDAKIGNKVVASGNLKQTDKTASDALIIPKINPGEEAIITFDIVVTDSIEMINSIGDADNLIDNIAYANAENDDPCYGLAEGCSETDPGYDADLSDDAEIQTADADVSLIKTAVDLTNPNGFAEQDETLKYTFTLTNNSIVTANNYNLIDNFDDAAFKGAQITSMTTTSPNSDFANTVTKGDIKLDVLLDIPANSSVDVVVEVKLSKNVSIDDLYKVENTACVFNQETQEACDTVILPENDPVLVGTKTVTEEDNYIDGYANPGETLTYDIEFTNTSSVVALDTVIKDDMSDLRAHGLVFDVSNVDAMINGKVVASGNLEDGSLVVPVINPGETVLVSFDAVVPNDVFEIAPDLLIKNIATANPGNDNPCGEITCDPNDPGFDPEDPIYGQDIPTNEVETPIVEEDIDFIKTSLNQSEVEAGDIVTYNFKVENYSDAIAKDVKIVDNFDSQAFIGAEIVSIASNPTQFMDSVIDNSITSGDIELDLMFDLQKGQAIEFTVGVKLAEDANVDMIYNNACVENANEDQESCDDDFVTPPGESDIPNVIASKRQEDANSNGILEPNEEIKYTIRYTNKSSEDALNVVIKDDLTDLDNHGLTYDVSNVDVYINGQVVASGDLSDGSLVIPIIKSGETAIVEFVATAPSDLEYGITVENMATANPENDENDDDIPSNIVEIPSDNPDLDLNKSGYDNGDGTITPGETVTYEFKITNHGNLVATDVNLVDQFEDPAFAGAQIKAIAIDNGQILENNSIGDDLSEVGQDIKLDLNLEIPAKTTSTVKVVIKLANDVVLEESTIYNTAVIDTPNDDLPPIEDDNTIDGLLPIVEGVKIVSDENNNNIAEENEVLSYRLEFTNTGNGDAIDTVIYDPLTELINAGATFDPIVDAKINGNVVATGNITDKSLVVPVIKPGETVVVEIDVTLPANLSEVDTLSNIAYSDPSNDYDCEDITSDCSTDDPTNEVETPTEDGSLEIIKVGFFGEDNVVSAGETVTYKFKATNKSEIDLEDVSIIDNFASDVFLDASIVEGSIKNDQNLVFTDNSNYVDPIKLDVKFDLKANQSVIFEVQVKLADHLITDGFVYNEADIIDDGVVEDNDDFENDPNCEVNCEEDPNCEVNCEEDPNCEVNCEEDPNCEVNCEEDPNCEVNCEEDPNCEVNCELPILIGDKTVTDANGNDLAEENEVLTYKIEFTNTSNVSATDVLIQDKLEELIAVGAKFDVSNQDVLINGKVVATGDLIDGIIVPEIKPLETAVVTFDVVMPKDLGEVSSITNVATATDDDDTTSTPPAEIEVNQPDVILTKTSDSVVVQPGSVITYNFIATNTSDTDVENISLVDEFNDSDFRDAQIVSVMEKNGLTFEYGDEYQSSGNIKLDVIFDLKANESANFIVEVKLADELKVTNKTEIENTAVIVDEEDTVIDSDDDVVNSKDPNLKLYKTVDDENQNGYAENSETLTYTIRVVNSSNVKQNNVIVKDPLTNFDATTYDVSNEVVTSNGQFVNSGNLTKGINVKTLAPGEVLEVEFDVELPESGVNEMDLLNIAYAGSDACGSDCVSDDVEIPSSENSSNGKPINPGNSISDTGMTNIMYLLIALIIAIGVKVIKKKRA